MSCVDRAVVVSELLIGVDEALAVARRVLGIAVKKDTVDTILDRGRAAFQTRRGVDWFGWDGRAR
ncbi:hypothetical protein [Nocardia macrotermitis]|uniref:hypothetical protein n=1 Tax=Nocardia macrotermitis TaxID=2585198 RepID=UPI001D123248|nr:hypothetical protein [Nocardia macrotermitis]